MNFQGDHIRIHPLETKNVCTKFCGNPVEIFHKVTGIFGLLVALIKKGDQQNHSGSLLNINPFC